jgi:hypothetical protein
MWNNQAVWQLAEEPSIEPVVRATVVFLMIAVSAYLTVKVFLPLGFTSTKMNRLLNYIDDALEKSDFPTVSKLANTLPKNCPETGLSRLVSVADVHELGDVTKILKEADLRFHAVMRKLNLYVEISNALVHLAFIGLSLWFIMRLQEILMGISSQRHLGTSVVAASLGEVIAGTAELLAVVTVIYVLERLCAFRISARRVRWELFVSSLKV